MNYNYRMKYESSPEGKGYGTLNRNHIEGNPVTSENPAGKRSCASVAMFSGLSSVTGHNHGGLNIA